MADLLHTLTDQLDAPQSDFARWDAYYDGVQPLAFLSPEAKAALGDRLGRMVSNVPRLAVTSLAERLRVIGFEGADVWPDWIRNNLDQHSGTLHREALTLGSAYCIVWGDRTDRPVAAVESAKQVTALRDPGTGETSAALKRWSTSTTTEAVLWEPDRVRRFRAPTTGATAGGFQLVETLPNPLGVVPVVEFRNADRLLAEGVSEITDLAPLVDALNKTLADMLVTSEYAARPRRWATGIELEEDETGEAVNPIPEGNRAMISENPDAKFGQLDAADMAAYRDAVSVLVSQIMAVSALPAHYLGALTDQPASADALRASEAALTARAEARQQTFGRSWEQVARLLVAVRTRGQMPAEIRVQWNDPSTRSVAQEADAVVKLFASGLLPASYALKRLGYADDEISEIRTARRAEALDSAGVNLTQLLPRESA
ncbi:MAG TPA: phage portal protein [Nocardioides sp.]|uniref:phage portal protein n=1 Tax=Nocardioides sp. TaxID=35761 RepID=UPI002EDA914D